MLGDLDARTTPFRRRAVSVQAGLGITHGAAFDLQAVCSGFVYGLVDRRRAAAQRRSSSARLLIGAETFSRILDWTDRTTCVLFGDGAGAVVLEAQEQPGAMTDRGVLTTHLRSDGRHKTKLYVDGGPSSTQTVGHLRMEGKEVFRHAVAMITDVVEDAFKATGYAADDHRLVRAASGQQAASSTARRTSSASTPAKVVITVDRHGNTSAASIPLALCDAASRTAASSRATSSCSRPWAAASPGARRWCGCRGGRTAHARMPDAAKYRDCQTG